jgi:hypothetical protein
MRLYEKPSVKTHITCGGNGTANGDPEDRPGGV